MKSIIFLIVLSLNLFAESVFIEYTESYENEINESDIKESIGYINEYRKSNYKVIILENKNKKRTFKIGPFISNKKASYVLENNLSDILPFSKKLIKHEKSEPIIINTKYQEIKTYKKVENNESLNKTIKDFISKKTEPQKPQKIINNYTFILIKINQKDIVKTEKEKAIEYFRDSGYYKFGEKSLY